MNFNSWTLTDQQLCDCELIMDKSFYPLNKFMNEKDYNSVLSEMRLSEGTLFPLPITLDVDEVFAKKIAIGDKIILREKEGFQVAYMKIETIWRPDLLYEAKTVYGTFDRLHPAVNYLLNHSNPVYIGGAIEMIAIPTI